jgi:hypothetical protein
MMIVVTMHRGSFEDIYSVPFEVDAVLVLDDSHFVGCFSFLRQETKLSAKTQALIEQVFPYGMGTPLSEMEAEE